MRTLTMLVVAMTVLSTCPASGAEPQPELIHENRVEATVVNDILSADIIAPERTFLDNGAVRRTASVCAVVEVHGSVDAGCGDAKMTIDGAHRTGSVTASIPSTVTDAKGTKRPSSIDIDLVVEAVADESLPSVDASQRVAFKPIPNPPREASVAATLHHRAGGTGTVTSKALGSLTGPASDASIQCNGRAGLQAG